MESGDDAEGDGERPHTGVFIQGLEHGEGLGVVGEEPHVQERGSVRRQETSGTLLQLPDTGEEKNLSQNGYFRYGICSSIYPLQRALLLTSCCPPTWPSDCAD